VLRHKYPQGIDDEAIIAVIISGVLEGLVHIHGQNQAHREIQSSNILFAPDGRVLLSDVGFSSSLDMYGPQKSLSIDTACYKAPEVLEASEREVVFEAADLWSLGIVALELAFGKPPYFSSQPAKLIALLKNHPSPSLDTPEYETKGLRFDGKTFSNNFKQFVELCLHKDPSKRPSAKTLLTHAFMKVIPSEESARNALLAKKLLAGLPSLGERYRQYTSRSDNGKTSTTSSLTISNAKKEHLDLVDCPRPRRIFVFTPQGHATSLEINPKWKNMGSLCAAASAFFTEPKLNLVPATQGFAHAYFYPSMADVDDLDDLRENDHIVVVPTKLENGQLLNGLGGGGRARSSSHSGIPVSISPRGGMSTSEWSNIVPIVEPSYHPSTRTFEQHTTLETERFCMNQLESAIEAHQERIRTNHIADIFRHIESFAIMQDRASLAIFSMEKSASRGNFSSSSPSLPPFELRPTTPRGGIVLPTPVRAHAISNSTSSLPNSSIPRSVSSLSRSMTSLSPAITPPGVFVESSPASGEPAPSSSSMSDSAAEIPILLASSSSQQQQQQQQHHRHAFEWERSENEIRVLRGTHILTDKWEERDKSKRERSRLLSADEERLAKKMEKRQSKVKVAPQRGIIAALGTMPRTRPDTPSRPMASSLENAFDSPDEIVMDSNGKVLGMTLDRLIQRLTSDSFPAVALAKSFLLTYRLYMSPTDLVNALESRWDADGPPPPETGTKMTPQQMQQTHLTPSRLRLLTLTKQWAFKHGAEDFENGQVRNAFFSFAAKMERCGIINLMKEIENGLFKKRGSVVETPAEMEIEEPPKNPLAYLPPFGGELFDFHPLELARQITILEKNYLDCFIPQELLNLAWTKKNKDTLAPNVLAMIRFSNFLVDWMCTEILKPTDPLERAMVINRFIYVGQYCMELNNFNGTVEVLSALRRSSIYRLRRSWNYLSDRAWNVFEQMELLFEPDANYKNYRAVLEKVLPPCIPYVGRLLSDILFLEEKEPTLLASGSSSGEMVNLVKMDAMANILKFLTEQQNHDYRLSSVEIIISYLYSREVFNEKQAYNISLDLEKKPTEAQRRLYELSPSALVLEDSASRNDVFVMFRGYLESKSDANILMFYKQVYDWTSIVKTESDQSKRVRELAGLIFDAFVGDRSEQHISFAKDALLQATIQEIEWKVKEDTAALPHALFKPLLDSIIPVLQYHFAQFKRELPAAPYTLA
jgi:hypothetical protein